MPVDVSSYGLLTQPSNPLDMAGKLTALQGQTNQNRLFQQEYNSKLGLGQIYKQAIDPATGQLDTNKLNALMTGPNSGNISLGLPQAYQNSQEAQSRNIGIQSDQLKLAKQNTDTMLTYLTPLLAKKDLSSSDVVSAIGQAVAIGHADPNAAGQFFSILPRDQSGKIDEGGLRNFLSELQVRALDFAKQFDAQHPAPVMQDLPGGGKAPFVMPQVGQVQQVGPSIQAAPPPTTQVFDQNGQARFIGNPQGNNPYEPSGAPAQATPQASVGGGGGAPAAAAPRGIGGQLAESPPGVKEAAGVDATNSANDWAALRRDVGSSSASLFQLQKAMTGLQGANTGPGTETVNNIKSFLLAQTPDSLKQYLPGVDPNAIKNRDEADKYLTAFASGAAGAFAPNTNEKLATALSANASTHISNLAAQDVVKATMGLIKMKQAQAAAFQASGLPSQQFSNWAVGWNKDNDPRAFVIDQMDTKERTKMFDSMNAAEKKTFVNSVRNGVLTGVISLSTLKGAK